MLPSRWPQWAIIPVGFALVILILAAALVLEPAAQALMPRLTPTPTLTILRYAAPQSRECILCHTQESTLRAVAATEEAVRHAWINPADVLSTHGRLGCITCHGGIGGTTDLQQAHTGLIPNPSDYREAGKVCLTCHADMRTDIPERYIHTPHERILWGIREGQEVCACSNCHGPMAHGEHPVGTHKNLVVFREYCIRCHEEKQVPPERLECAGCHISPHDIAGALACDGCHTSTTRWSETQLAVHPVELTGRHAQINCFDCHRWPNFGGLRYVCSDCHQRPHDFGNDNCERCHVPEGWKQ